MYSLLERIEGVLSYKVVGTVFLYVRKDERQLYLNNNLLDNDVGTFFYLHNDVFYVKGTKSYVNKEVFSDKRLIDIRRSGDCKGFVLGGESEIIGYQSSTHYYYQCLETRNVVFLGKVLGVTKGFLSASEVFFATRDQILSFSIIKSNHLVWHLTLEQIQLGKDMISKNKRFEVRKFIGSYEDKLIVQLSSAALLFLGKDTGEILKVLHLQTSHPMPKRTPYSDDFSPHLVEDRLIWLNYQRLLHIDLNNYKVQIVKDYFEVPESEQFRFMKSTYYKGRIYFVADYGWEYVTPSRIGMMDARTGDVLWQQQLFKTGGLPEPPQVTEDRLYIRTAKGTLYVFELEE